MCGQVTGIETPVGAELTLNQTPILGYQLGPVVLQQMFLEIAPTFNELITNSTGETFLGQTFSVMSRDRLVLFRLWVSVEVFGQLGVAAGVVSAQVDGQQMVGGERFKAGAVVTNSARKLSTQLLEKVHFGQVHL